MSNLVKHAEFELKKAGLFDKDSDYGGMLGDGVMELIKVFAKQGHSGMSASMTTSLVEKLMRYEPLSPLTGEDDEWNEVGDGTMQNRRDSRVFKYADGTIKAIDAIIWRTQKRTTWSGSADGISSGQEVKGFPFTHKTFYIDVTEKEVSPDNWEFHINDRSQLNPVWEHYKKPVSTPNEIQL